MGSESELGLAQLKLLKKVFDVRDLPARLTAFWKV